MELVLPRILGALMVMLLLCIASSLGFLQIQGLVVIIYFDHLLLLCNTEWISGMSYWLVTYDELLA